MIIHADQGFKGRVWDLDEQRFVPHIIWVDESGGRLEAARDDGRGRPRTDINGDVLTYRAKGRFKFIPKERKPLNGAVILDGAEKCLRCHSPLTLPGSELCPRCNGLDKGVKTLCHRLLRTPFLDRRCEGKTDAGYRCNQLAVYQVGDEVTASPQRLRVGDFLDVATGRFFERPGRFAFSRAQTVRQRFYCAKCWRPPALLDAKGETVRTFENVGARPQ